MSKIIFIENYSLTFSTLFEWTLEVCLDNGYPKPNWHLICHIWIVSFAHEYFWSNLGFFFENFVPQISHWNGFFFSCTYSMCRVKLCLPTNLLVQQQQKKISYCGIVVCKLSTALYNFAYRVGKYARIKNTIIL